MKPTETTNRLHFEDLSPERFEDLGTNIVKRMCTWKNINPFARTGGDDGIDTRATEESSNKVWCIQCKRYQKITATDLISIVDKIIQKNEIVPDVILTIIACNASKAATDAYENHAKSKGINDVRLISASTLEAMLYHDHPDLLSVYFGVKDDSEEVIKKRIEMKQKFKTAFIEKYTGDSYDLIKDPRLQFKCQRAIIRDVKDKLYPGADEKTNIAAWFKCNLYDIRQEYFEVIMNGVNVLIDEDYHWDILSPLVNEYDTKKYSKFYAYEIAQIPYENIVEIDIEPDDYYNLPTIYCQFIFSNKFLSELPFAKLEYDVVQEKQRNVRLNDEDRKLID